LPVLLLETTGALMATAIQCIAS